MVHTTRVTAAAYDVTGDGQADGQNALESDMMAAILRIQALTGATPKYVCGPGGNHNTATDLVYTRQGLKYIGWHADPENGASKPGDMAARIKNQIIANVGNKTDFIILFHDTKAKSWAPTLLSQWLDAIVSGARGANVAAVFPATQADADAIMNRY